MKFTITKEWLEKRAAVEKEEEPLAGFLPLEEFAKETNALRVTPKDQATFRMAFGVLINHLRVNQRWSTKKLAERAEVDERDLVAMECTADYSPEPRVVYQLARALKLAPKHLMQVSGLLVTTDSEFRNQVERFATSAKCVDHLSKQDLELLSEFVRFLGEYEKPNEEHPPDLANNGRHR